MTFHLFFPKSILICESKRWIYGTNYPRMDQVKFVEDSLLKKFEVILSANTDYVTLNAFKGCLPKISLGPFVNTLSHINV